MSVTSLRRAVARLRRLTGAPPAGEPSDRQLLARFARSRDEAAFAELVARHGPLVRGVGRRVLGPGGETDDVFQATFLLLARKAGAVAWRADVGPWLHAAAYRLALKARAARRPTAPLSDTPAPDADPS